jgi:multidrug efflux pump subunit AcrB
MVSQILNFGLPAPIDIQIVGPNLSGNRDFASQLLNRLKFIPGTADLRIQQTFNYPKLHLDVDRTKASQIGYSQFQVANNLLVSLSGSFQTSPSFWLDPKTGVSYQIATQTPQYQIQSLQDIENIPLSGGTLSGASTPVNVPFAGASSPSPVATNTSLTGANSSSPSAILGNVADISRGSEMSVVSHYDVQPVIDIFGSVQGRDLGGVAREIDPILKEVKSKLPRGSQIIVRGQILTMRSSFNGLLGGLFFSIVLVYLLIVVNFQSWLDPFIILMALPAALAGIVWFLFVTGTTISVPALTGTIMCMGVATANSILVVSFAKEKMEEGMSAPEAALSSGFTRFRPVLMTALAMIIGMLPMSLGLGEGGEQNAPLGRAVIGGLLFATVATLFFVPVFISIVHGRGGQTNPETPAPEPRKERP